MFKFIETDRKVFCLIQVQGTHFSVAMVRTDRDVDLSIETTEAADKFLYHKFFDDTQLCNHHGIPSTLDFKKEEAYWQDSVRHR